MPRQFTSQANSIAGIAAIPGLRDRTLANVKRLTSFPLIPGVVNLGIFLYPNLRYLVVK